MEVLYTFIVIISGTLLPSENNQMPNFLGGTVMNHSQMYFTTEESCNAARNLMEVSKDNIINGLQGAEVTISECLPSEFEKVE